ncbi:LysR substrate-binding domain-containing protein [Pseudoxanthobacter sp. M-2]|uniref:LysR substrate-binding domain-containing protein n=1 Tax=Pseudoxanthobacter sp. M-2 TaxID=3078754 RepID=UPI0038FC04CA
MAKRLPSLTALRAFEATARLASVTRAADELHVTQSAVSRHLRTLEDELGLPLVRRVHRGVAITPAGRTLAAALSASFERIGETIERLTREKNSLRLRALPSIGVRWLWPRLHRFEAAHPEVRLHVDILWHNMQPDDVEHDVGIRVGRGAFPEEEASLLMVEQLTPVCAPSLLLANPRPWTAATLARLPLLHGAADYADWRMFVDGWSGGSFDVERGSSFDVLDMALRAAEAGRGVLAADINLIGEDLAAGRLVAPCDDIVPSGHAYYVVCPDRGDDLPAVRFLRDWLIAEAQATVAQSMPGA